MSLAAPDSISLTINGNPFDLSSSSLGNGRYLISKDFVVGTYTFNIDADMEGYLPADTISKQLQVSDSGTTLPPSGGGGVGGGTGNQTGSTGGIGGTGGTSDNTLWVVVIILAIGGYFLFGKKK